MGRYIGPVERLSRRFNEELELKGPRRLKGKGALERRPYPPGQFGSLMARRGKKMSDYGLQLREKQKCRFMYMMREKQFRTLVNKARRMHGVAGTNLLQLLERRLDNFVYRAGMASTRLQARQLVSHCHLLVDGKKCNVPSYLIKPGQTVEVREKSRSIVVIREAISDSESAGIPPWIERDADAYRATMTRLPEPEEINIPVNPQPIIELYSR